ncbi:MAG: Gfo/Idh/MocA family oxidoreductase [Candidatus Lokiarchaeota archaeon]|nr:Gfo/Idh/MocA family oxidoreductase [Candidatus Lokiarchaeota archaeon]
MIDTGLKIALMGFGFIGKVHAMNIKNNPGADLVAVFSSMETDKADIEKLGAKYHADWRNLLATERVDAIVVATPTFTHEEICLAAIERGMHLFLEKPMERTLAKCETINKAAKRKGIHLGMGHVLRFDNEYISIKEQVIAGTINPKMVRCTRRGPPPGWATWFCEEEKSGTVILDLSIHDIDFMCWLAGTPPVRVSAVASPIPFGGKKMFGISHVVLDFNPGKGIELGFAEASWGAVQTFPFSTSIEVSGKNGLLSCAIPGKHPLEVYSATSRAAMNTYARDGYYNEIDDFITSIGRGKSPKVTGDDGYLAVKVSLAALESAKRHETIKVEGFA